MTLPAHAWRGVLIDLDGTLMDTAPDLADAVNRMRADLGLPALPLERVAAYVGKGADVLVHRALTDDLAGRAGEEDFARGRALFFSNYHAVNGDRSIVFNGVPAALRRLRDAGLRLACVTNKPREFTVPLLDKVDLAQFFDATVAGDDVPQKKPHPALLLEACRRLHLAAVDCLMIGDSINDALAAHAAGCPVVLVETGYNEGASVHHLSAQLPDEHAEARADAIVPSLSEAAALILAAPHGATKLR
ncbi:MAG: phosphoglycolate phosphatase [Burkholderiales bacterium]|nr:phosphoglycolate phosphatase [Burkholderiales bacterium]